MNLNTVPIALQEPILKEAFDILERSNWTLSQLDTYERDLDAIRVKIDQIETAHARGKAKERITIAKKMLIKKFDIQTIAETTGLSIKEVEALALTLT